MKLQCRIRPKGLCGERGATLVEYGVILALVVAAAIVVIIVIESSSKEIFGAAGNQIGTFGSMPGNN